MSTAKQSSTVVDIWPNDSVRQKILQEAWDEAPAGLSREASDARCELQREALVLTALDILSELPDTHKPRLEFLMSQGFGLYKTNGLAMYNNDKPSFVKEDPTVWRSIIINPEG